MARFGGGGIIRPINDWVPLFYSPSGLIPSVILDFVYGRYWDGLSENAQLSSLISGNPTVVPWTGMLCNSTSFNAAGALLTALKHTSCTVCCETVGGTNGITAALVSSQQGAPDALLFESTSNVATMFNGVTLGSSGGAADWTKKVRSAAGWDASGREVANEASALATDANANSALTSAVIGSYNGTDLFGGFLRRLVAFNSKLSANDLRAYIFPGQWSWYFPINSFHMINFSGGGQVSPGGTYLKYEYTQPWSFQGGSFIGSATVSVIFTNVITNPWFGYEFWADATGLLRCRIMSNWDGTSTGPGTGLIDVHGTTNIFDSKFHVLGISYDGSGTAGGIRIYVDGVAEQLTVISDGLGGGTIITGAGPMIVGNQSGDAFNWDILGPAIFYNVAKPANFFSSSAQSEFAPTVDASTTLYYDFREGTGTTTADRSGNGMTGTISGSISWF